MVRAALVSILPSLSTCCTNIIYHKVFYANANSIIIIPTTNFKMMSKATDY